MRYEQYKPVKVGWLDQVPAHWEVKKLKHVALLKSGNFITAETITPEGAYPVFGGNGLRGYTNTFTHEGTFVLVGRQGALCGNVNYAQGSFYASEHALVVLPQVEVETTWLGELLRSMDLGQYSQAAAQPGLSAERLQNLSIPVPPLPEQRAIAAYLDSKTAQLDALLAQKQALLQKLHQQRQALINEAVTQGLNMAAPRKPSGVAWLGDVPAHWDVKKLKYLFAASLGGGTPDTSTAAFWNGDIPWVSPKDMKVPVLSTTQDYVTELAVKSSSTNLIPEKSVMVVVRSGILKHTFPIAINAIPVTLNQDMKAFVPNELISAEYLAHLLKGFQQHILNQCTKIGATVDSIETEWLYSFPFPVPPPTEQQAIVDFIEAKTSKINEAATTIHTQIQTLKAYRQSLISEVVTGKVDVRATPVVPAPASRSVAVGQQTSLFG